MKSALRAERKSVGSRSEISDRDEEKSVFSAGRIPGSGQSGFMDWKERKNLRGGGVKIL